MAKEYNSISMPATPMYPDGSFEGKVKRGFKRLFSFGKKKNGSLDKSRSGSERGSSSRIEEEGQRSRRSFSRIFKRPKNRPVDGNPADYLIEAAEVSITDNAQQAEDGEKLSLMGRIEDGLHILTNRHSGSAPKEGHKPAQLDQYAGVANKQELKKTAEAQAVGGHAVNKDPSPAHGSKPVEKEAESDQHHQRQHRKDGEATTNLVPEAAGPEAATPDNPLVNKEPNGCETLCKGLQRVCLPWTVNKDD